MNNKWFVGSNAVSFQKYDETEPITGIVLWVDSENCFEVGNANGYVMEIDCPYGTAEMASNLLTQMNGKRYKGFNAEKAIISPLAEMGDSVTVNGVYSMLAYKNTVFGVRHTSQISAPGENEVEHEYSSDGYVTREFNRQLAKVRSSITKTAENIELKIEGVNGNVSTLSQTVGGLATRVESAEGNLTTLTQTATSLTTRVESAEGSITTVQQTASGLSSTVTDLSGKYTSLKQTVDGFDFTGLVTFTDLENELNGYATESGLQNGTTTISGDCITTGLVSLEYLDISNGYGSLTIEKGSTGVSGTKGACLTGPKSNIYFIVTDAACRMTAKENNFYVSATRVHSDTEIDVGSDARLKNTVEYDLAGQYGDFYRRLRPCRFKYNNGTSDRFHTGFIAQEVEQAIADSGLDTKDLAALVKDEDGMYALRYAELIALNTAMIQRLMTRVDELEERLKKLEGGI